MIRASEGLRFGASTNAVALADLKAEDIIAGVSEETKASLAASLAPPAPAAAKPGNDQEDSDDDNDAGDGDDGDEDDKKMKKVKATSFAAGQKAANERFAAVAASEHFEGREKAAMKMLGTSMSADEITGLLADMPKGGDASAEMLAALRGKNPNLGTGADDGAAAAAATNHGWAEIHAEVEARRAAMA